MFYCIYNIKYIQVNRTIKKENFRIDRVFFTANKLKYISSIKKHII